MRKPLYSFKNIGVCYYMNALVPWKRKPFWALRDVSFDVYQGETVGIVGRNGAGKSSLLRMIAGIIKPDRGQFISEPGTRASLQALNAGFNLLLSGRQNIYISGLMMGIEKTVISQHFNDIIELSELGKFIDEPVKNYSSGMKARLGFSISYFMNPDVLLIDEVLSVGDQRFREKSAKLLKEKIASDSTVMIVSHVPVTLELLCDRIICIDDGCSLPELPVQESLDKYLNYKAGSKKEPSK